MASKPWELTDEDIIKLYDREDWRIFDSDVYRAKAAAELQRKKLIEWGDELCPHDYRTLPNRRKRVCDKCWQELMED